MKAEEAIVEYRNELNHTETTSSMNSITHSLLIQREMQTLYFVSDKGYLGLVISNAKPGDEIWVPCRCNNPHPPRKRDDGNTDACW